MTREESLVTSEARGLDAMPPRGVVTRRESTRGEETARASLHSVEEALEKAKVGQRKNDRQSVGCKSKPELNILEVPDYRRRKFTNYNRF